MEDIIKQKGCQIFRATGCEFRVSGCGLRVADPSIADLGFEISDWKD